MHARKELKSHVLTPMELVVSLKTPCELTSSLVPVLSFFDILE